MFILKKGHQPGVYVPLRALFLVAMCPYETSVRHRYLSILAKWFCSYWIKPIVYSCPLTSFHGGHWRVM